VCVLIGIDCRVAYFATPLDHMATNMKWLG